MSDRSQVLTYRQSSTYHENSLTRIDIVKKKYLSVKPKSYNSKDFGEQLNQKKNRHRLVLDLLFSVGRSVDMHDFRICRGIL